MILNRFMYDHVGIAVTLVLGRRRLGVRISTCTLFLEQSRLGSSPLGEPPSSTKTMPTWAGTRSRPENKNHGVISSGPQGNFSTLETGPYDFDEILHGYSP